MSTHPNVILLCTLTPDGLTRATARAIAELNEDGSFKEIKIGEQGYYVEVMEENYLDNWQLSGKIGDILVFDLVTYGYGEQIAWAELASRKTALEAWAEEVCVAHHCSYVISVTANYW